MPRLIDADKLRKDVLDLPNCYNGYSDTYDKACIIDIIEEQPTVEVVRCKDCIHNSLNRRSGNAYCELGIGLFQLYDFCSEGERRKDER